DVVKQRARDGQLAVDLRERAAQRMHALRDREAVLEQPVPVRLVVALGGRRLAPARPDRRSLGEEALEQLAQVAVLRHPDRLADPGLHLLDGLRRALLEVAR